MRKLILILCVFVLTGCPQQQEQAASKQTTTTPATAAAAPATESGEELEVWADPLLVPALEALTPDFEYLYAPGYRIVPKERGELLANLSQDGGPELPDVICADAVVLAEYNSTQRIEDATLRTFAGDRLVLAERPGTGYKSPSLYDISKLRFDALGLGEATTLAGYYGEQALISEGVMKHIEGRIKRYPTTPALVDALNADEVQTILVTASAAAVDGVSAWLLIGEDVHEDIRYQAAASLGKSATPGVPQLLRFLAEDEDIQAKFEGYCLVRREIALDEEK